MTLPGASYPLVSPPAAPSSLTGRSTTAKKKADAARFGRDTYCVDELRPGRLATGVQLLAQRCYHRLTTPGGALRGGEDEADFGKDLAAFVGSTEERDLPSMLPVVIQNELRKDPEVDSVAVEANQTTGGGQDEWEIVVSVESAHGPFDLVLAVSSVTVELLGVR